MAIQVIGASYGTLTAGNDATAKCQELVNLGNDDITANNTNFGDPDVGVVKKFGIVYRLEDGTILARACSENETIDLVAQ